MFPNLAYSYDSNTAKTLLELAKEIHTGFKGIFILCFPSFIASRIETQGP